MDETLCGDAENAFDETIDKTSKGIEDVEDRLEKSMFKKSRGGNLEW
jgi:hypothetical protein